MDRIVTLQFVRFDACMDNINTNTVHIIDLISPTDGTEIYTSPQISMIKDFHGYMN